MMCLTYTTKRGSSGFTLVELLFVVGMIALLAAILFPVFVQARAKARQTVCVSNLRQLGIAVALYSQDSDDLLPYGADPDDKYGDGWQTAQGGKYWPLVTKLPLLPYLLKPYASNKDLWHCPADTGFDGGDIYAYGFRPQGTTLYGTYGMSYFYHTALALAGQSVDAMVAYDNSSPYIEHGAAEIGILFDAVGQWHGGEYYEDARYDVLMGDGHVSTLNGAAQQSNEQWTLALPSKQ